MDNSNNNYILHQFIIKLHEYEPDLVNEIKYYINEFITNETIPLLQEIYSKSHSDKCYATYHGTNYFINHFDMTIDKTSCARCKIQRDFEKEYGKIDNWIFDNVTKKIMIHTNNKKELMKIINKWSIDKSLLNIIDSPWWYESKKYEDHIKLDFPTRHPNGHNISYLDPNREIRLNGFRSNTLTIDDVSYSAIEYNFNLDP